MEAVKDSQGRVLCKCGSAPEMNKTYNLEGPENSVHYRLECPKCGAKDAPWRRSQLVAMADWETGYWKV